jgi:group I intron endonuclease
MSCGIYQILNSKTGKCYVGSAVDIEDRWIHHRKKLSGGSGHHSVKLQRSWNKYGPDVWEWKILQECEESQLTWLEAFWICKLDSFDNGYNSISITLDGERLVRRHSEETREKIRVARAKQVISEDTKKKMSLSAKSRKASEETKKRISDGNKNPSKEVREKRGLALRGQKRTDEVRKKMSESHFGHKLSDETKAKLSKRQQGRILSDETKKKIGLGNKGKVVSEATKQKLREIRFNNYKEK